MQSNSNCCGHCAQSCANPRREEAYFLISNSSVVVVGKKSLPTKIIAVRKYQPVYKQMATPRGILSSPGMLH